MVTTNTSLTMLDLCDNDISDSVRLKTSNSELEVTCVPVDIETTETPKQVQPVSAGWCSWIQCADSYDTRSADEQAVFCHAEKGNCEGACAQGEGAGAKWCTESTNTGGCPSMCLSEEAADCDKECTPCLANALGTTTSGKACSTCTSCLEYAVCASCGEDALFQSAFIAAMTELGLTVTEITAFGEMVEGLPENSPLEKLLNAAGEKAFGETDTPPTLEAMTAAMKTFFASAEFRTELEGTEGVDADLLAAVSTASENAITEPGISVDAATAATSTNATNLTFNSSTVVSSPNASRSAGKIVGGIFGGLVLLCALIALAYYCSRIRGAQGTGFIPNAIGNPGYDLGVSSPITMPLEPTSFMAGGTRVRADSQC